MTMINQQRLVQHFLELVRIDSESGNEAAIAATLAEQLGQLGFDVQRLTVPEALSNGFNLYARLEGRAEGSILLSCHMDTVTPGNGIEPVIEAGIIRSKGDTILGGDDKSGIAAIMEAVRVLREQQTPHPTIELAFTVYEEGGLHGSKHFDMTPIQSNQAIVLDSGGPIGTIITVAPGQQNLKITLSGKPAHAGLAPESGINALTVAAEAITRMRLSRIDEETTANIGVVRGGAATNIVMPELYLEAEARSLDDAKLATQTQHMIDTFEAVASEHGAQVAIDTTRAYNAYRIGDDHPLVASVKAGFEAIGVTPHTRATGGGSDANIFNERGLTTVNLSTGMAKVHTTEEEIAMADLVAISRFLVAYLSR
ncbi:M20/M25/M40 family metallo-hydrolase [Ferrimonas sediminicola]|uniref:M20/M25/M40 family metallo-hydrolase n=1 Tax=Ferrimonas sediminicola TaxID=2569538 RepID=A0A4U1B9B7_9GAMM|nr:M20/M25/M40 family metallo-hydrolase [Ferrimonas sediminicola]TKB47337.1 M20/M25/M40 family metallo-hydrolase [Ferrimonas sediminicola]